MIEKVLLTGASGFLGKVLYQKMDRSITTLGRTQLLGSHISNDLQSIFTLPYFHTVIHNAGKAHTIPKTEKEIEDFYSVNFTGTKNLLNSLSLNPPQQFIFISTIAVYGLESGTLISENRIPDPNTPYGESKWLAEKAVKEWAEKNSVNYHILRLPLVVGSNPPGNLGAIKKAIQKRYYFKIKNNKAQKSMVLANDIAKLIINLPLDKSGIYNLTDGIHPAFNEVEASIEHRVASKSFTMPLSIIKFIAIIGDLFYKLNFPAPLNSLKLKKMTSTLTFDDSKARRELDWNPNPVLPFIKDYL